MSTSVRQRAIERSVRRAGIFADWMAYKDLCDLITDPSTPKELCGWAIGEVAAIRRRRGR